MPAKQLYSSSTASASWIPSCLLICLTFNDFSQPTAFFQACITWPLPQIPFCLCRKSITTRYLMRVHSQAQHIDFPALSSCLECPGASPVKVFKLIHVIYKADVILSNKTLKETFPVIIFVLPSQVEQYMPIFFVSSDEIQPICQPWLFGTKTNQLLWNISCKLHNGYSPTFVFIRRCNCIWFQ